MSELQSGSGKSPANATAVGKAHVIDVTAAGVVIDDTLFETFTVSALSAVLGEPRIVRPDPAPDPRGIVLSTLMIWDDSGLRAYTKDDDVVSDVSIRVADDPEWERELKPGLLEKHPSRLYGGTLTVAGRSPLDAIPEAELRKAYVFLTARTGHWESTFFLNRSECGEIKAMTPMEHFEKSSTDEIADIVRGAAQPFREVNIGYRAPKPVKKSSGKWKVPTTTEPVLTIASFPFRLAIIQELMFHQSLLTPRFNVYDFAQDQGARSFDPAAIGYEIIPAVRTWFRKLPIPASLAEHVETLVLDGGNDIYLQLIPQWDGEDDVFTIKSLSAEDLSLFPNLRAVDDIGGFLGPRARAALTKRGITLT